MKPMTKVIDIKAPSKAPEKTNLAAAVEPKLADARTRLAHFEAQVGAAALAASLDEPGAAKGLAELNSRMDAARRDVGQLEQAHRIALDRDARALSAFEAHARRAELAELQKLADARLEAMVELCGAIETAAKAYAGFFDATDRMALAIPTGMIAHNIAWHGLETMMPDGRAFPAPVDKIIASEMYRHTAGEDVKRRSLPGAHPLIELLRLQPDKIEPATEGVKRMNEYLVDAIKERFSAIEAADAARFAKTA
jgi:hypothetical protein